jgi:hypothetical protein
LRIRVKNEKRSSQPGHLFREEKHNKTKKTPKLKTRERPAFYDDCLAQISIVRDLIRRRSDPHVRRRLRDFIVLHLARGFKSDLQSEPSSSQRNGDAIRKSAACESDFSYIAVGVLQTSTFSD